jgi:hypothetical protein
MMSWTRSVATTHMFVEIPVRAWLHASVRAGSGAVATTGIRTLSPRFMGVGTRPRFVGCRCAMLGKWGRDPKIRQRSRDNDGDEELQMALDRLSRDAFELGLYNRNEIPEGGTDE